MDCLGSSMCKSAQASECAAQQSAEQGREADDKDESRGLY